MSDQNDALLARRKFIKLAGAGMALAPLATIAGCSGGDSGGAASAPASQPAPKADTKSAAPKPKPAAPAPTAGALPKVSEDDAVARTLGYKHDAADVDLKKFPKRGTPEAANQYCSNCILYQAGDGEWGGCALFGNKQVKATGWCASWAPRAAS